MFYRFLKALISPWSRPIGRILIVPDVEKSNKEPILAEKPFIWDGEKYYVNHSFFEKLYRETQNMNWGIGNRPQNCKTI